MTTIRILGQTGSITEKIRSIKLIRTVTNLGLQEAKNLFEQFPNSFEVPSSISAERTVSELRDYGYMAETDSSSNLHNADTERAFKIFLIALINDGEYDQVVTFIKTKRHGSVAGAPTRTLEPM